ncbi:MAG TPA: EAL domain-containing protein [Candidatus Binataceae bacterium]|nr:EAL domain-containing protein [Candidatus Binataceae bacterium]
MSNKPNTRAVESKPLAILQKLDGREWWLWGFAVVVTLVLTAGIVSLTFPQLRPESEAYWTDLKDWVRGLAALVLLFDLYTMYQQLLLQRIRRKLAEQDQLFQVITENAADMIAVIDSEGHRIYNSPSYEKVLGYSQEELKSTSSIEQVHPEDRPRVIEAAAKAGATGRGERLEYRIRHKDGSWRFLESTASVIRDSTGKTQSLVVVNRDISERKWAEDQLAHNAFHDALTNLPNRALFLDRVQHSLTLSQRHISYQFAVLFIDIDQFKRFNDSLGHSAGDELLVQIGKRLSASLRGIDTVSRSSAPASPTSANEPGLARLGGDEFTVLLEGIHDSSDAIRVAERIQERLAVPFRVNSQEAITTASVGIAFGARSYSAAEELIRDAEIAMYRAKSEGQAQCRVFDQAMHELAIKKLRLETELRQGLELGEFQVYYQPIVSLETEAVIGFEALSRWQRPSGLVSPAEFIPIADETGIILPMNRALLRDACEQLRNWQSNFEPALRIGVNITPKQFAQPDLAAQIGEILKETGIAPQHLDVEITENIAMGDADRSAAVLSELKALGIHLSIDDFGTGYSSLSRLQGFPIDSVKIDRAFISKMCADAESSEIVRIIIMLAHNLGMSVVAEGVETNEELKKLRSFGCEMAQGYLFSRPVDRDSTNAFLRSACAKHRNPGSGITSILSK